VWVRHGCRAEFTVRNGGSIVTGSMSPPPLPMGQTMVACESKNGRRSHCPADTRFGASLYRQNSESSCIFNSTWGFDSKGIWVTSGCRGEFAVNTLVPQTAVVIQQPPRVIVQTPPQVVVTTPVSSFVKCESINNGFERCSADTRFGAQLARQMSDNACVFNSTWGFDGQGIWVKNGCRGEFAVNTLIPQTSASMSASASSSLVRCESKNNGRNECPADTRFGVAVFRQLSDNNCVLNNTWGFDSKGIWVKGGCRADFVLNP
jgi:ribosomal protein L37AE/L43A